MLRSVISNKFAIKQIRPRYFAISQEELLRTKLINNKSVDRYSPSDGRTTKLIDYVKNKDYTNALKLVKQEGLHPDSHNYDENTVLTDCAKRGDVDGVKFALNRLGCSITVSCHCPKHRSCFHYASMEGHINVLDVLYRFAEKNNMHDINLLDVDGNTHLDVARDNATKSFILKNENTVARCQLSNSQIYKLRAPDV